MAVIIHLFPSVCSDHILSFSFSRLTFRPRVPTTCRRSLNLSILTIVLFHTSVEVEGEEWFRGRGAVVGRGRVLSVSIVVVNSVVGGRAASGRELSEGWRGSG